MAEIPIMRPNGETDAPPTPPQPLPLPGDRNGGSSSARRSSPLNRLYPRLSSQLSASNLPMPGGESAAAPSHAPSLPTTVWSQPFDARR